MDQRSRGYRLSCLWRPSSPEAFHRVFTPKYKLAMLTYPHVCQTVPYLIPKHPLEKVTTAAPLAGLIVLVPRCLMSDGETS